MKLLLEAAVEAYADVCYTDVKEAETDELLETCPMFSLAVAKSLLPTLKMYIDEGDWYCCKRSECRAKLHDITTEPTYCPACGAAGVEKTGETESEVQNNLDLSNADPGVWGVWE